MTWTGPAGEELTATSDDVEVSFQIANETDKTVEVRDDKVTGEAPGELLGTAEWNAEGESTVFEYSMEFDGVAGQCVDYTNTAVIPEGAGEDASEGFAAAASVLTQLAAPFTPQFQTAADGDTIAGPVEETVTVCVEMAPEVSKTADAAFDREYFWLLEKEASETEVTIREDDEVAEVEYLVAAIPDGFEDSGWVMSGEITVTNPNSFEDGVITVSVTDETNVGAVCTVNGGEDVVLEPGETRTLTYECAFESQPDYEGINTATVSWTGPEGEELTATSDEVPVTFELDRETNFEVTVFDDLTTGESPGEELGTATWNEDGEPTLFFYLLELEGVPGECVDYTNTAVIPGVTDPADETVTVCTEPKPGPGPDPKPPVVPSGDPVSTVRIGLLVAGISTMLLALLGLGRVIRRQNRA